MKIIAVNEFSLAIPETPSEWKLHPNNPHKLKLANNLTNALIQAIKATSNQQAVEIMKNALLNNNSTNSHNTKNIATHFLSIVRNKQLYL